MSFLRVERVAIIGAGLSGLVTARHCIDAGIRDIVVFERADGVGGIWAYTENDRYPHSLPEHKPLAAANELRLCLAQHAAGEHENNASEDSLEWQPVAATSWLMEHSPMYASLKSNIPISLQGLRDHPYDSDTPDTVPRSTVHEYLQRYADKFKLHARIKFGHQVCSVRKVNARWDVTVVTKPCQDSVATSSTTVESFDAVVVAAGREHTARVPEIPGLRAWKAARPHDVQHSRSYRRPNGFENKTVLVIGGRASAVDIGLEVSTVARKVYQSTRGGKEDAPLWKSQGKVERIPEVAVMEPPVDDQSQGRIKLVDGSQIDVDKIIVCTGYHLSFPFLAQYHDDEVPREQADDKILVSDGSMVHNLHRQIFYIPDPTLAFVGLPTKAILFPTFDYQGLAVAHVFAGLSSLPSEWQMRQLYQQDVRARGFGRDLTNLSFLGTKDYIQGLLGWIQEGSPEKLAGPDQRWITRLEEFGASMASDAQRK